MCIITIGNQIPHLRSEIKVNTIETEIIFRLQIRKRRSVSITVLKNGGFLDLNVRASELLKKKDLKILGEEETQKD